MTYLQDNDPDLHELFEGVGIMLGVLSPADAASVAIRAAYRARCSLDLFSQVLKLLHLEEWESIT